MNRLTKWMLLLAISGPAVVLPSCLTTLARDARDASFAAFSTFVEQAALDLLQTSLGIGTGGA